MSSLAGEYLENILVQTAISSVQNSIYLFKLILVWIPIVQLYFYPGCIILYSLIIQLALFFSFSQHPKFDQLFTSTYTILLLSGLIALLEWSTQSTIIAISPLYKWIPSLGSYQLFQFSCCQSSTLSSNDLSIINNHDFSFQSLLPEKNTFR